MRASQVHLLRVRRVALLESRGLTYFLCVLQEVHNKINSEMSDTVFATLPVPVTQQNHFCWLTPFICFNKGFIVIITRPEDAQLQSSGIKLLYMGYFIWGNTGGKPQTSHCSSVADTLPDWITHTHEMQLISDAAITDRACAQCGSGVIEMWEG